MSFHRYVKKVLIDSNDLAVWSLNDATTVLINSGTAGVGANMTATSEIGLQVPSKFDYGISVPERDGYNVSAKTAAGVVQPSSAITVSAWIFIRAYFNNVTSGRTLTKSHNAGAWSATPISINLCEFTNTSTGAWRSMVRTGSDGYVTQTQTTKAITLHEWHHVGLTYDGATITQYLDGMSVGTTSASGSIDYGTNGEWFIGSPRALGSVLDEHYVGLMEDVRIAQVARPASWFKEVWGRANGHWRP